MGLSGAHIARAVGPGVTQTRHELNRGTVFSLVVVVALATQVLAADKIWSPTVNGLQARLVLVQKPNQGSIRWLVPYLELRTDYYNAATVDCDRKYIKLELLDGAGQPVKTKGPLAISGPVPSLGIIPIPTDSSISISLELRNQAFPNDSVAAISAGGWALEEKQNGKVFLRATLSSEQGVGTTPWRGTIQTPEIKVSWK